MLGDNKTILIFIKNFKSQNQIKHIIIIDYNVHGLVKDGEQAIK